MSYFETTLYTNVEKYVKEMNAVGTRVGDLSEPLKTISESWTASVKGHFAANGPGWPALSPATIERYGPHPMLINPISPGDLFGSIYPFSRSTIGGVFAVQAHAALIDHRGRKAGFGRTGGTYKRRGKTLKRAGRKEKGRTRAEVEAAGSTTRSWPAMPPRPFMYTDEKMNEFALTTLSSWIMGDRIGDGR